MCGNNLQNLNFLCESRTFLKSSLNNKYCTIEWKWFKVNIRLFGLCYQTLLVIQKAMKTDYLCNKIVYNRKHSTYLDNDL